MPDSLLPCPFCGSADVTLTYHVTGHCVRCRACQAEGPVDRTDGDAVTLWNRRADAAEPRGRDGV